MCKVKYDDAAVASNNSTTAQKISLDALVMRLESRIGFKTKVMWLNVFAVILVHLVSPWALWKYGLHPKWQTLLFTYLTFNMAFFGVSAGPHRYWSHRSFKATLPLRIIIMICYSLAGQKPIRSWVRDHRVHHKYSDTDADPHSTTRGYFYAHIGCYLMKKHPETVRKGKEIDMSDIDNDHIARFHDTNFQVLRLVISFIIPILACTSLWKESWTCAAAWQLLRFLLVLHANFALNSLSHAIGTKPYNRKSQATDNDFFVKLFGDEGYHNYHHAFPWDYRTSEFGTYALTFTTPILHFFKRLNWAWDFKTASPELIEKVAQSRGDGARTGSSKHDHHIHEEIPEEWNYIAAMQD